MSLDDYSVTRMRVNLENFVFYNTYFAVEGLQVILTCGFNTRNQKRWVSLKTVDNTVLLYRTFIEGRGRIYPNVNVELYGISFFIVLEPKNPNFFGEDFRKWKDDYYLTFVSNPIEFDEEVDKLILDLSVGGRV